MAVVSHTLEQPGLKSGQESEQVQIQEQDSSVVSAQEPSMQNTMSALQKQESPWSALAPQYQLLNCSLQCKRGRLSDCGFIGLPPESNALAPRCFNAPTKPVPCLFEPPLCADIAANQRFRQQHQRIGCRIPPFSLL